ncbi:MAG: glycosyltransferase family 4 protein [bacterium]
MRIGFITTEFVTEPNHAGGLSHYTHRMARLLMERGHEVNVFTYAPNVKTSWENFDFEYEGLPVHRIPCQGEHKKFNKLTFSKISLTVLWIHFSYQVFRRLQRFCAKDRLDIIQTPNLHGCGFFSHLFLPVPMVVRISSYSPLCNKLQGRAQFLDYRLLEQFEFLHLRRAQHIFAPSKIIAQMVKKKLGAQDIRIIPSPFYLETKKLDFGFYAKHLAGLKYILFFSGRLGAHKGPHILAKTLCRVLPSFPDVHVVFIGKDVPFGSVSMRKHIYNILSNLDERVHFFDSLSHSQLYPVIQGATVITLPSLIDNLPNACLEAMGLGAIVIGTRGTGFDGIIEHEKNGFLVEPGSITSLENILIKVLSGKEINLITINAKKALETFAPERVAVQLEAYYEEILANHRPGQRRYFH